MTRIALVALVVLALAPAAPAAEPEGWAYDMWHDLMSPYCPGRTLAECPSPQADELRLWILTQEAAGVSRPDVEEMLLARFGDEILSAPRAEGWGLAAYLIPVGACAAAAGILVVGLRRLLRPAPVAPTPAAAAAGPAGAGPAADLERLVDQDLERLGNRS